MNAENKSILTAELKQAVQTIKGAILQSQSRAARMISGTQLSLYFGVGLYVSETLVKEHGVQEPSR